MESLESLWDWNLYELSADLVYKDKEKVKEKANIMQRQFSSVLTREPKDNIAATVRGRTRL